jgi:ATP-dependent protease ClpP protease subunit
MPPVVANVRFFDDYGFSMLESAIKEAKRLNQAVLPILINSPGGEVYALLRMVDSLKASGLKTVGILNGIAMSCGSVLFAFCDKRYMSENSTVMVHPVSHMAWGTTSDVQSSASHAQEKEAVLYSILNNAMGKGDSFVQGLISGNNGADVYLNADKCLEYGLIHEISIPDITQIINEERNSLNNYKMLLNLASDEKPNFVGGKKQQMDLEQLLAMLNDEQKKPINALKNLLDSKTTEAVTLKNQVSEITLQMETQKQTFESKLSEIEEKNDKDFVERLINKKVLAKADEAEILKDLKELNISASAKDRYKRGLENRIPVVQGAIPDAQEQSADLSNQDKKELIDKMKAYAKEHKLDLLNSVDYLKALKACKDKEGGAN